MSLEELRETSPLFKTACVQGKICTKHFSIVTEHWEGMLDEALYQLYRFDF